MLDYFYGGQAEQFSFYRIPKLLFTDERFRSISAEAKVLYGILLDRMSLSQRNGWLDDADRVYIIFTTQDIMDAIDCADQKATKLLSELEQKAGLIERKRQGLGKPNLIYVKNFIGSSESRIKNRENHDSRAVKIANQESLKSRCSNTDFSNTDYSDTDSLLFTSFRSGQSREPNRNEERQEYREIISENIGYEILREEYRYDQDTLDEILELMVDVVCCYCQVEKGQFWPTRIPQFGVKNELTVKNLLTVGKPVTLIGEVENLTSMSKPVEECRGKDGITEDFGPTIKAFVGSKYDRCVFIQF